MRPQDVAIGAAGAGRRAEQSSGLDHAVRGGLVAYGVVHLLIAWLALQLALGDRSGKPSSSGALAELTQQPLGGVLIWGVAVGLALLVGWRLLEATVGHRGAEGSELWRKRAVSLLKAVLYGALAVSAVKVATGSGGGGSTDTMTARLMGLPGGLLLVGAVGLAVIGYGAVQIWRGWTEKFLEHLDATGRSGQSGTAYTLLGKVGHVAKGIALIVVGGLFCYAALTQDPKKSGGLDAALQEVLQQPFGPYLLGGIALGIGCYGLFCFARARHLDR